MIANAIVFVLAYPLGWADTTTELSPDHSGIIGLGFSMAFVLAAIGSVILWRATAAWPLKNQIGFTAACAFFTFLAATVVFLPTSEIVEGWIDFPPSKTVTYKNVLLKISRAYQTHGKGRSWNIQTMPIWSNIDITQDDYNFMLSHRSSDDHGTDTDEITSNGYFCANVTIQKAGDALRIMNAGKGGLPRGTIILCPPDFERHLHV